MEEFLTWLQNLTIFWKFNLPFSLGCMPMMYYMLQLNRRTGAMNRWELFKMVGACFVPMLNVAMFFQSYITHDERYWQTTRLAIKLIDDMDRRLAQGIAEDKDMLAVMLYGAPLMRFDIPEEELKKVRYEKLKARVVKHLIAHFQKEGHAVTICEDQDGVRFLQVHLGGFKQ